MPVGKEIDADRDRRGQYLLTGSQNLMLMETTVLSEIVKTLTHRGIDPQVYFWRTMAGTEVDIVVETGGKLVPIEIKLSATPLPAMASAVKVFRKGLGDKAMPGYMMHSGEVALPIGKGVSALPFAEL